MVFKTGVHSVVEAYTANYPLKKCGLGSAGSRLRPKFERFSEQFILRGNASHVVLLDVCAEF